MKQLSPKELEQIISLYIDGELESAESTAFEEYLATHPVTAREVETLITAKRAFTSKQPLAANEWFWLRLSQRLEIIHQKSRRTVFALRPVVSLSAIGIFLFAVSSLIYFKDAPLFHRFFIDKQQQVESLYQSNFLAGDILPLFTNLNTDDILNFALFGNIAIDSSRTTSLQVKNSDANGSQIQIVKNTSPSVPQVTLKDFSAAIGISENQRVLVDSILGSYREKLQASVLVNDNDEVAIHAELADMNRAMVSTIAACLELPQRSRFQRYLDVKKAPYTVVALNAPKIPSHIILSTIPKMNRSKNYVVISPDSVEFAEMNINLDSIRENAQRIESSIRKVDTERMVAELTARQRTIEENYTGSGENRFRVSASNGAFQIHFRHASPAAFPGIEVIDMVRPRTVSPTLSDDENRNVIVIGDSVFSFDMPADNDVMRIFQRLPRGEFHFEIVDSMFHQPKVKLMFKSPSRQRRGERPSGVVRESAAPLIDLDSLLRDSDSHLNGTPKSQKPSGDILDEEVIL